MCALNQCQIYLLVVRVFIIRFADGKQILSYIESGQKDPNNLSTLE
jgi:hypothetical protein